MDTKKVTEIAQMANIADTYISAWGDDATVEDKVLLKLLDALGYDTQTEESLLKSVEKKPSVLPAVVVMRQNSDMDITLNLGKTIRTSDFSWMLMAENGEVFQGELDDRETDGKLMFRLAEQLPMGYHQLTLKR